MNRSLALALVFTALAVGALVLALVAWIRLENGFPKQVYRSYAQWQREIAEYLIDRTTPKQFALQHLGAVALGLLVGIGLYFLVAQLSILVLLPALAGLILPPLLYRDRVRQRRETLQQQIDPALQLIANALQVAPNLDEALNLVAQHLRPPMSEEVARVTAAYRLGRSMDDALQDMAQRCNDPFITAMVIALVVGRRTGGNISATLRRIAHSTREAVRAELELNTKTRGQRNQFYLVAALYPLGLIGMKVSLPSTWEALLNTYNGKVALFLSMAVVAIAVMWAQKILNPKNL